jgi:uncharacterized glyoxalase superfamily metalloenzyme YdcJ
VEQRGLALTAKDRALYDRLLATASASEPLACDGSNAAAYAEELKRHFEAFPGDYATLRAEELGFFRYSPTAHGLSHAGSPSLPRAIEELLHAGYIKTGLPLTKRKYGGGPPHILKRGVPRHSGAGT